MSESNPYDAYYFAHCCGPPYDRSEHWLAFFGGIAARILAEIAPRTVLDAGCAMGLLVEALRDGGAEAEGIDVSEYALERVREDVRPYCRNASVTEPLERDYDLVVCIEVLEHLPAPEARSALDNLCAHTNDILFSSTPENFTEATHVNVQPPEYWAEELARRGFLRDVDFDASFVTPWAARFRKDALPLPRAVAAYERRLWQLVRENRAIREELAEQRDALARLDRPRRAPRALGPAEQPSVTIVVLNHNGLSHLEPCFSALRRLDYDAQKLELMLVDNASTDGSVELVRERFPEVRVVASERNVGFSAANNLGAREARGEYVVFLNNDTAAEPGFVVGLVEAIRSGPDVVCAGAKMLDWEGERVDFVGGWASFAGHGRQLASGQPYRDGAYDEIRPLLFACGGAMMIGREVFLDVGGFDEDFFIYFEDVDLGWRLWVLGHEVVFAPRAIVRHRLHGTMDAFPGERKAVLYTRNALYSMIKNYDDENLGRTLPAALVAAFAGIAERAQKQGKLDAHAFRITNPEPFEHDPVPLDGEGAATVVALADVAAQLPTLMEKRRRIQQNRRRSDRDVASLFRPFAHGLPGVTQKTLYRTAASFGVDEIFAGSPRRVLVFSPDLLPYEGLPTVGSGLRAWGLGQGLRARGHDVVFSMPALALDGMNGVTEELRELAWTPGQMAEVVERVDPDAILLCSWPIVESLRLKARRTVPVIVDQHGPHLLERAYQQHGDDAGNRGLKSDALAAADYFTCAGERQLAYFRALLGEAGWSDDEIARRTAALPFSLAPDAPPGERTGGEPSFVYGGVWLPWQDPSLGLSVLVGELDRRGRGSLTVLGGRHPWLEIDAEDFDRLFARLSQSPRVELAGTVPHAELLRRYGRAHVAFDLMKRNPERELAFTSRTVEYLWCGLPVVYNDYAELADYIREYDAGWTVDPEDREAIAAVVDEIFERPDLVAAKGEAARRLVRERLSWDRTISPIDEFVRRPTLRENARPFRTGKRKQPPSLPKRLAWTYRHHGARGLAVRGMGAVRRRAGSRR